MLTLPDGNVLPDAIAVNVPGIPLLSGAASILIVRLVTTGSAEQTRDQFAQGIPVFDDTGRLSNATEFPIAVKFTAFGPSVQSGETFVCVWANAGRIRERSKTSFFI